MSLAELWSTSRAQLEGKQVHQIIAFAGNGNALEKVSERWKPYRSVASWYLWRHIDGR